MRDKVTKQRDQSGANAPKQTLNFVSQGPVDGSHKLQNKHVMSNEQTNCECGCAEAKESEEW